MKQEKVKNCKLYGAYGSNLNLTQMSWRCPNAKKYIIGYVNDYCLTFRRGGYANIEPSAGDRVPVLLWKVDHLDELALDRYEGYPRFYVKVDLPVETEEGTITAMFYVMAERYAVRAEEPSSSYYYTVHEGYTDNNLPLNFLHEAIKANRLEVANIRRSSYH